MVCGTPCRTGEARPDCHEHGSQQRSDRERVPLAAPSLDYGGACLLGPGGREALEVVTLVV